MNTPNLDNEIDKLEAYKSNDILSEQGKELLLEFKAIKKAFSLHAVSQHRELLIAFKEHLDNRDEKGYFITEYVIDEFIESNL